MSEKKPVTYWKVKQNPTSKKWEPARGRIPEGWILGWALDKKGKGAIPENELPKDAIKGSYTNAPRSPKSYIKKSANVGPVELTAVQHIQEARKTATKRIAQIEKEIASLNAELKQLQAIATL